MTVLPEEDLARLLYAQRGSPYWGADNSSVDSMLEEMGEAGWKYLRLQPLSQQDE
jgi:hypothetical protein